MERWADLGAEKARATILNITRRNLAERLYNLASLESWASFYELDDKEVRDHLRILNQPTRRGRKRVK